MNFAILSGGTASQVAATTATAETVRHRKLTDAAQQFEGMLLQEMLKPMKEHGFCQDESDTDRNEEGSGSGNTLSSYGTEAVATAIARGGGLGIAKRVVAQVEGEGNLKQSKLGVQN